MSVRSVEKKKGCFSDEIEGDKAFVCLASVERRRQTDYIMLASRSLWSDTVL